MKKVVVAVPFSESQKARLKKTAESYGDEISFITSEAVTEGDICDADAVIGNVEPDVLKASSRLSWLQLNSSGVDAYVKDGVVPEEAVITSATGAYGTALSEYMVAMLLVMMKKIPMYMDDQKNRDWKDEGPVASPAGKRILIVGTGDAGLAFARRIKAFELPDNRITLSGIRRRADFCPEPLNEIHPTSELAAELEKADVVAATLPGTEQTYHIFDREMLLHCKKGAYFLNAGRGSAVDEKDRSAGYAI
ncbi:MAG: D-2-hydroxyacid dehydrogenase [Lachnospiraceae bacterium]|uniref:D-2-hydroxyacid dehydrogenase n=1 Tax=Candidatus Weimeria bifida TaxID=2599074 RepID=A0A6N7J354_9FIRM|nr:D-2-hydroxyacid dehydrogenase [Candidatus Weimeria bifida]RRF96811.1 MAG: D-2-hydroxyacid dehydrogenase [Lachnospiraceae bacterium]